MNTASAETPPAPPPARVLIVDDEPSLREGLRDYLEDEGCSVVLAANGAEAVAAAETLRFDACVMDVRLPGAMDGTELAVELRRRQPALRVVIHTGSQEFRVSERMRAHGLSDDDILLKPLENPTVLLGRLLGRTPA